ncbi:MAG: cell envelope integrity protein TolA [Dissulfuribacterales bacterium]
MTRRAFGRRDEDWYLALASAIFIHVFIVLISVALNFFWKRTITVPMVQNVTLFDVASLPQAQKGPILDHKTEEGEAVKPRVEERPAPPPKQEAKVEPSKEVAPPPLPKPEPPKPEPKPELPKPAPRPEPKPEPPKPEPPKPEPPKPVPKEDVSLAPKPEPKKLEPPKPEPKPAPKPEPKPEPPSKDVAKEIEKLQQKVNQERQLENKLKQMENTAREKQVLNKIEEMEGQRAEKALQAKLAALEAKAGARSGQMGEAQTKGQTGFASRGADVLAAYVGAIADSVQRRWALPDDLQQKGGLFCVVEVKITRDGSIKDVRVIERSKNALFDQTAVKAVQAANPLPVPPEALVKDALEGIELKFTPTGVAR